MTLWDLYEKCKKRERGTRREQGIENMRVMSLYVTGMLLRECLCPGIDFLEGGEENSFEQIWYLICEYHEKGREKRPGACVLPDFDMEKNPVYFADGRCVERSPLTKEELIDFFYYRKICCKMRRTDHGIAGGLLLYESMVSDEVVSRTVCVYAASTLMCHNAFVRDMEGKHTSVGENPLLCLLLFSESVEPLHLYRGEVDRETMRMFLKAVNIEKSQGEMFVTVAPDVFPFDFYMEKLFCVAGKTGVRVSVEEKCYKIHIKSVNSDDY